MDEQNESRLVKLIPSIDKIPERRKEASQNRAIKRAGELYEKTEMALRQLAAEIARVIEEGREWTRAITVNDREAAVLVCEFYERAGYEVNENVPHISIRVPDSIGKLTKAAIKK